MLNKKCVLTLKKIKDSLDKVNLFRNSIVHANWQTLTKNGYVRVKILFDNNDGFVKFKTIKITPTIIHKNISKVYNLTYKIRDFKEKIYQD